MRRSGRVFEQEAPGAGLQRPVHVLVEVEGGDHDDRQRVDDVGSGELAGGLDAVHPGHADVEQAHVGPLLASEHDGFPAVGGPTDDLDAGLGVEDHPQACPDDVLVVGDEHADGHVVATSFGSTASTVQPPPGSGPAWRVPPSRLARSAMPTRP